MRKKVLLDTGPLVSYLKRQDQYHNWAKIEWKNIELPLLTCEAVISEACFLLKNTYKGQETVIALIRQGVIEVSFNLQDEAERIEELITRYQSVPMSLADGCLVRMSELIVGSCVLTLDSDFRFYRKNKNEMMDLIIANEL